MERAEWLTREVATLPWYAHYLAEAIEDPRVARSGRNACLAAAKYLASGGDLIPDSDPVIGLLDDLFVALYALSELMKHGGREVADAYSAKPLPPSGRLGERCREARANFPGFWNFVVKEVTGHFQEIARSLQKRPDLVGPLVAELRAFIQAAAQRPVYPIDPAALELFLRHHQASKSRNV